MTWTKNPGEQIPTKTTVEAMKLFYSYKMQLYDFVPPEAKISYEHDSADTSVVDVHMDVTYNDSNIHLRSIKPEDHEIVQTYLNSQILVRGKYGNKKIVDAKATKDRVTSLSTRFDPKNTDGCFMHGGFVITDNETDDFLGMANSGASGTKGASEIAYLLRADAWSHKPADIVAEYHIPENKRLHKDYKGTATAIVCSLVQYTKRLKEEKYKIKGEEITGMCATAMVDNPGSWKAIAKAGFEPYDLDAKDEWGPEIRYQLGLKI